MVDSARLPKAVRAPFERLAQDCEPMRKVGLLLNGAEALLKFAAARAVLTKYPTGDAPAQIRTEMQRPSLGKFLSVLRHCITMGNSGEEVSFLSEAFREWQANAGDDLSNWIVETRNKKWGHAAILEEADYAALSEALETKITALVEAIRPLLLSPSIRLQGTTNSSDQSTCDSKNLSPLVIFRSDEQDYYFFNSAGDKGIEYICYSTGQELLEPKDSQNYILFQKLFPRPLQMTERSAHWFDGQVRTKLESYYRRAIPETCISEWLHHSDHPAMVLLGEPGFGKTSLLAHIIQAHKAACYHLFDERSGVSLDLAECFLNLALQLKEKFGLEFTPHNDSSIKARAEEFEKQLLIACELTKTPIFIVIDALDDECRSHSLKEGKDPKSFLYYIASFDLSKDKIRWLFSARPEIEHHHWFQKKLGTGAAETLLLKALSAPEARAFLSSRCIGLGDLLPAVVKASEGSPLYLSLFTEEWNKKSDQYKSTVSVPKGVNGYYRHIIKSIKKRGAEKATGASNEVLNKLFHAASKQGNEEVISFLKHAKSSMAHSHPFPDELLLLGLHSLAYEALSTAQVSEIMEWPVERCLISYAGLSSLIIPVSEGRSVHHNALRDLMLQEELECLSAVRSKMVQWASDAIESRSYAARWGVTHMCDALVASNHEEKKVWESRIANILTSLVQIEFRAKLRMLPQLLKDYDRFFTLCPEHGGPCPLPIHDVVQSKWLGKCTDALIRGLDTHLDKGTGKALISLRALKPLDSFKQRKKCSPPKKIPNPPVREGSDVLEYAEFVRSCIPALSNEKFNIGQLAENFCSEGAVAESGRKFRSSLMRIKLANPPSRTQRRTLRRYDEPFQFVSKDLREGWIWKMDEDDETNGEVDATALTLNCYEVWTQKLVHSFCISVPSKPEWDASLLISENRKHAILGNFVLNLSTQSVHCVLPFERAEIVASDDLKIAFALLRGSFNRQCVIIDVFAGTALGQRFSSKEIGSIAISFDGRLAAYGAYYGIRFIDVANRTKMPYSIDGYKVSGICFGENGSLISWSESIPDSSGEKFTSMDIVRNEVISRFVHENHTPISAYADLYNLALTISGELLDCSQNILVDSTGHSTARSARFGKDGMFYHTGYELREIGASIEVGNQIECQSILMLGKENGCLVKHADQSVALYSYGSKIASTVYVRDQSDAHFVSHWVGWDRDLTLEPGYVVGISVTNDHKKVLLGYDDGLLYIGDLNSGEMRRVNSPESIRKLINSRFRRFIEESCRQKTPDRVYQKRQGPRYSVSKACISGDGRYAATVCHGEKVRIWSVETGENITSLAIPFGKSLTEGEVDGVCFSSDGEALVILRADHYVMIWNFLHSKHAKILNPPDDHGISVARRDLMENNGTVAAYLGGWLTTWSYRERSPKCVARLLRSYPWAARINLRTQKVLSWDIEDGPSKISVFSYPSLDLLATHHLNIDSPTVSNLADDGSFAVASNGGLEFFETHEGVLCGT